ncbi:AMIN domain-containing protein [Limnothrix sp. FACHB-1083]|nr:MULTISPECIES: type IV pilus secretin family protein [unclassified Limnothrix]MBD2160892.1 AMIN domain-containing protein [Limnothrix sp. FACHB-1083]MBD2191593.1 AMIN domain-containing protein [Limnothrix sp. FACHB-1088]
MGGLATVAIVQPALAETNVLDVRISGSGSGVDVELVTDSVDRPQVFLLPPQGTSLIAHVAGARLVVPGGNVTRANPAPGIAAVEVTQLDGSTVQVTVRGTTARPTGRIRPSNNNAVLLSYAGTTTPSTPSTPSNTGSPVAQTPANTGSPVGNGAPNVLVPNPTITIDGQPAVLSPAVAPPTMPRAIAPPVGDIAISDLPIQPYTINLGSNQIIPRLVLREAPVREVLSLLARASGVNIAFADNAAGPTAPGTPPTSGADARISLDIENESAQDVFNYVLRISGLQANRSGRTIFVGRNLPNSAQDVAMRSVRLNQVRANEAAGYLVILGAESATAATERTTEVVRLDGGSDDNQGVSRVSASVQAAPLTQTRTSERTIINPLRHDPKDSVPILRGLQIAVDARTNSITLVGRRDLIVLASDQLSRIDSRLRQAVVNVRVIDINLLQNERLGTSFSFGIGGTRIINTGGLGVVNWSDRGAPFSVDVADREVGLRPSSVIGEGVNVVNNVAIRNGQNPNGFNIANDFLAQLQASVVNGNAKILTDPTLVVQEGQVANVELTEEVIGKIKSTTTTNSSAAVTTSEPEKEKAGLILGIQIDRIDDNGFVTLSVSPSLKTPVSIEGSLDDGTLITLLNERKLSSGTIRLRDGQTLVLAGIIQDIDRSEVRKIPILGDLPLLGSLFRRTDRRNERKELVVLLTPQLLDDSNASTAGYSYTPSREAQELIQRTNMR